MYVSLCAKTKKKTNVVPRYRFLACTLQKAMQNLKEFNILILNLTLGL